MAYVPRLEGFVVIGRNERSKPKGPVRLWLWDGVASAAKRLGVRGLEDLRRAEGVCPVTHRGQARLLLVSDDGKRKKGKRAHYALLRYDQLVVGG